MLFPGQKTTLALERTAQYSISAFLMVGQLLERMINLASPERRLRRVDLQPSTYLPLLMTRPNLLLMFSEPTFFTIRNYYLIKQYSQPQNSNYTPKGNRKNVGQIRLILKQSELYIRIIIMRKNSRKMQAYLFPKIHSAVITTQPAHDSLDSLQKYQLQFLESQSPLIHFRVNKRYQRASTLPYEESKLASGIKEVSRELSDLKKQIRQRRKDEGSTRLGKLLESVEDNLIRNRSMTPGMVQQPPMYVPIPFPMYMPPPNQDSFYRRTYNRRSSSVRFNRSKNNMRRWRKVGNCILFYLYLKRFCKLVQLNRKLAFQKFMNNIKPHLFSIKKLMTQSLKEFLSVIFAKKEVSFDFDDDDNKQVIKQKVNSLRKLIGLILQSLLQVARRQINSNELLESIYFLCRHGNYSCTEPLLTKEQLEIYCISPTFRYISADKHLEKAALINLILIKLLIYNTLLSPAKIGPKFTQYEIPQNLYFVSSVLYEFCIDYQDEVMMLADPVYNIGNYEQVEKVRFLESIVVREGKHREGQVISGLKDQEWVKKYFKFKNWSQQKKTLKLLIDLLQGAMGKFHSKYIQKYF